MLTDRDIQALIINMIQAVYANMMLVNCSVPIYYHGEIKVSIFPGDLLNDNYYLPAQQWYDKYITINALPN